MTTQCEIHQGKVKEIYCPYNKQLFCVLCAHGKDHKNCKSEHEPVDILPDKVRERADEIMKMYETASDFEVLAQQSEEARVVVATQEAEWTSLFTELESKLHSFIEEKRAEVLPRLQERKAILDELASAKNKLAQAREKLKLAVTTMENMEKANIDECVRNCIDFFIHNEDYLPPKPPTLPAWEPSRIPKPATLIPAVLAKVAEVFHAAQTNDNPILLPEPSFVCRPTTSVFFAPKESALLLAVAPLSSAVNVYFSDPDKPVESFDLADSSNKSISLPYGFGSCQVPVGAETVLVITGGTRDFLTSVNTALTFSYPAHVTELRPPLITSRRGHCMAVLSHRDMLLAIGGSNVQPLATIEECESQAGFQWREAAFKLCYPRESASVSVHKDMIYVIGGRCNPTPLQIEVINYGTKTVEELQVEVALADCASAYVSQTDGFPEDMIIILGGKGVDGKAANEVLEFSLASNQIRISSFLKQPDTFSVLSHPVLSSKGLIAIGDDQDLHQYTHLNTQWSVVPKAQWFPF